MIRMDRLLTWVGCCVFAVSITILGLPGRVDAGCTSDRECKGDRICENQKCVDPRLSGLGASCSKDKDCPGDDLVCQKRQCVQATLKDIPAGRACPGGDEFTPPGCKETDRSQRERKAHNKKAEAEERKKKEEAQEERKRQCADQKDGAEEQVSQSERQCSNQCDMMRANPYAWINCTDNCSSQEEAASKRIEQAYQQCVRGKPDQ